MADRARVAVVHTSPEQVEADYRRVLELSGCASLLAGASQVVVYGNLSWGRFFPAASSPPWQLAAIAGAIPRRGEWHWIAGRGHTRRPLLAARANAWPAALAPHHQRVETLPREQTRPYPRGRPLLVLDRIVPGGLHLPETFDGSVALHLPTFKTHGQVGLAGALENAWGALMPSGGGPFASHPHETLVDLLLVQRALHQEICAVMDGTIAGDGAGPRTLEPRAANVLLASTDPVALDAVAAGLAGIDPFSLRYLALAYAAGLGCADLDSIVVVGDDVRELDLRLRPRRPPAALARAWLEELRLVALERWLFRHQRWLALASSLYYDVLWYQVVGRPRLRAFRRTPWGHLFARYQAH